MPNTYQLMHTYCYELQKSICNSFDSINQQVCKVDIWDRPGGGGGRSCVYERGDIFEKAGVNVSAIHGVLRGQEKLLFEQLLNQQGRGQTLDEGQPFKVVGISLVCHPINPFVPIVHMNYRYFELEGTPLFWFGGGTDLTPVYLNEPDVTSFHSIYKGACDSFDRGYYPQFKSEADTYFYLPHRRECRGVGGIFFDYLYDDSGLFDFVKICGESFLPAYLPLIDQHSHEFYDDDHQLWQSVRRSRYVEFNLIYDRGTLFGLKTNGRIESILMSMPPSARWIYSYSPQSGSEEEKLQSVLMSPRDWV